MPEVIQLYLQKAKSFLNILVIWFLSKEAQPKNENEVTRDCTWIIVISGNDNIAIENKLKFRNLNY